MKPDDVQQLAQSFVASWETQLARALREPHMLSSLMGLMQNGGYGAASAGAAQPNPWEAANPFAGANAYANSFTGFPAANPAADAESGAPAGADNAQRIAALEAAIAALGQRMGQLEQQLAHLRGRDESTEHDAKPATKARSRTAASVAATGTGSRKPAAKKTKQS